MLWLTIFFGLCTVAGLIVSIIQLMIYRKGSAVERAKAAAQLQRTEHAKFSAALVHDTVHLAVQRAKQAKRSDLADLLRVARGSLNVLIRELEEERLKLRSWQFGKIFHSEEKTEVAQPAETSLRVEEQAQAEEP